MKHFLLPTLSAFAAGTAAAASPSVTLDAGTLQGGQCPNGQGVYYKGVPYAEPPVGELRFEPPKPYSKQYPGGTLDATTPAKVCIQFGSTFVAKGDKDEDCLYLDIWAPSSATKDSKLPVKAWVYGGSNTDGGITDPLYDGCNLADEGAILVSISYRLGPLGFLGLNSAGIYGNQGIQDILLALEWVQKYISAFGGDPKKVVLFGQSAGGTDVYAVASLPQAPSLMNSVIAESMVLPSLMSNSSLQKTSTTYAQTLHCSVKDKSCLKSKTVDALKSAWSSDPYLSTGLGSSADISVDSANTHKMYPYVDKDVIPEDPRTGGLKVPAIIGFTQQEGMMDTLTKYNSPKAIKSATPAAYTKFLQQNFGPAASTIEKYYPLSLFKDQLSPVIAAMQTVVTDAGYRCAGYQAAVSSVRNGMPVWMYEFTHNSTCVWLDTMLQDYVSVYGAAHTAELPYVFGNLHFEFANTTCTGTQAEYDLSKQMIGLWTAMAANGNPSTEDVQWPQFEITPKGLNTPGMVFANSSTPGSSLDFSVCQLWSRVFDLLSTSNSTGSATGIATATAGPRPSVQPTEPPFDSGAAGMMSTINGLVSLTILLTAMTIIS